MNNIYMIKKTKPKKEKPPKIFKPEIIVFVDRVNTTIEL